MNRRPRVKINGKSNVLSSRGFWKLGEEIRGFWRESWPDASHPPPLGHDLYFYFQRGFLKYRMEEWFVTQVACWGWGMNLFREALYQPSNLTMVLVAYPGYRGVQDLLPSNMLVCHLNYLELKLRKNSRCRKGCLTFPIPLKNGPWNSPWERCLPCIRKQRHILVTRDWELLFYLKNGARLICLTAEC